MLKNLIKKGEYQRAQDLVAGKDFYNDKESKLLKLLELGSVHYLKGEYEASLNSFDQAKTLSDKLFTVSISKKVKSAVTNDNYDNYYGEKYERSMIRYYQSLLHFLLSIKKTEYKEKKFHLSGSKAVLLEWNSLLDNYKSTTGGKVAYKDDLLAKTFGGFVHEHAGTRSDRRIALNLYKDAKKVLLRNFNTLGTYNSLSNKFKKNLSKLSNMPLKKVKKNYVQETSYAKGLKNFLNQRIKTLKKSKAKDEVMVIVEDGLIASKVAAKRIFPIPAVLLPVNVGKNDFLSFSLRMMALSAETQPRIYKLIRKRDTSAPFPAFTSDWRNRTQVIY